MKWSEHLIIGISVGIGIIILLFTLFLVFWLDPDNSYELSNNITIVVEIGIGAVIAIIVYGFTKLEQEKLDTKIKKISDIADTLESVSVDDQKKKISLNIHNLTTLVAAHSAFESERVKINQLDNKTLENTGIFINELKGTASHYEIISLRTPALDDSNEILIALTAMKNFEIHARKCDWDKMESDFVVIESAKKYIGNYLHKEREKFKKLDEKYGSDKF